MPLEFKAIRGNPTQVALRYLEGARVAPAGVTVAIAAAGAAKGAKTLPVDALSAGVPKNTRLVFDDAENTEVVVTADAAQGDTSLSVESYRGKSGAGITGALVQNDEAKWDGLYIDIASRNLDYNKGENTQSLTSGVHGQGQNISVDEVEVTSIAPRITRSGLFFDNDSPLLEQLLTYNGDNSLWWVKYTLPNAAGEPFVVREGLAKVNDVSEPAPYDDHVQLNYTVHFVEEPSIAFIRDVQGS